MRKSEVSVSEKKNFGSDTNTESGPWFRFPIPKPGFGRTLVVHIIKTQPFSRIFIEIKMLLHCVAKQDGPNF